jgi:hypothetical protein
MPLPPKPPLDPPEERPTLLDPLDDELPTLPREPADTEPALRLAVLDELAGAELMLLPLEALLTVLAVLAALLVAALTRSLVRVADLLVAAIPPPEPEDWPETAERDACSAVLRASVCADCTVEGDEPDGEGGGE